MYIKVEQINGKYRVTPDAQVTPVEVPQGLTSDGSNDISYIFTGITEKPQTFFNGLEADPNPWKVIDETFHTYYDEEKKTFCTSNSDIFKSMSIITPAPEYRYVCILLFLKFGNQVYAHKVPFDSEGNLVEFRFTDLTPFTEDDDNIEVTWNGNVLQPGVIEVPSDVHQIPVHCKNSESRPGFFFEWYGSGFRFNPGEEANRTLNLGVDEHSERSYLSITVDEEHSRMSIHKYCFVR